MPMSTGVSEFLLSCLRGRWDETALEAVRTPSQREGFAWDAVRDTVQREGIAPLLYAIARGRDLLPSAIEEEWRLAYFSNARRNLLLFHELARVLRELDARNIPAIVLKGVALAEAIYGNPAVRPMCDADVLVRCEDVPLALSALATLNYEAPHGEAHAGDTLAYENEVLLRKAGAPDMILEIHWSLFDSPYYQHNLALDWFWETATPLHIEDVSTRMLGPEAQLLHLCGHLLLHHGSGVSRILWLHDIAEVLVAYQETLDWNSLLRQAQSHDLTLPVRQLLLRVTEQWRIPIPETVLARLRALEPSAQEARVFADLTAPQRPVIRRFWADLASMPDRKTRLVYAWHSMFPTAAYMQRRYTISHPWLTPLYYPYRWWVGAKGLLRKK
jgi:hypothetical protein